MLASVIHVDSTFRNDVGLDIPLQPFFAFAFI